MLRKLGVLLVSFRLSLVGLRKVTALKRLSFYLALPVWLLGRKKRPWNLTSILIVSFVSWAALSYLLGGMPSSGKRLFNDLVKTSLFYFFVRDMFGEKELKYTAWALGFPPILITLGLWVVYFFPKVSVSFLPTEVYRTVLGAYLLVTLPFSLHILGSPLLFIPYSALSLGYMITIEAKAAFITAFLVVLVWTGYTTKRTELVAALAMVLALAILVHPHSKNVLKNILYNRTITYRTTDIWPVALKMIKEKPLLGWGFSRSVYKNNYLRFMKRSEMSLPDIPPHAHNNFLSVALMTGIPGLVIFLGIILSFLARCRSYPENPLVFASLLAFTGEFIICGIVETHFVRFGEIFFSLVAIPECVGDHENSP